jgi:uncharacterized protein (DUF2147 family)
LRLTLKSHYRPGLLAGLPTVVALVALQVVLPARGAEISPAGLWKTIDDKTHKPRGTVRIYEDSGLWFGRVESSFNPAEQLAHCDKCSDSRRGQPVIGMVILRGLSKRGSEYSGGDILDPETGTVYRCRFSLSANGQKLLVRGFIGISIVGRTQTWIRQEESAGVVAMPRAKTRRKFSPGLHQRADMKFVSLSSSLHFLVRTGSLPRISKLSSA